MESMEIDTNSQDINESMSKLQEPNVELVFSKEPSQSSIYHNSDYNQWLDDNIQSNEIEKMDLLKGDDKMG